MISQSINFYVLNLWRGWCSALSVVVVVVVPVFFKGTDDDDDDDAIGDDESTEKVLRLFCALFVTSKARARFAGDPAARRQNMSR